MWNKIKQISRENPDEAVRQEGREILKLLNSGRSPENMKKAYTYLKQHEKRDL